MRSLRMDIELLIAARDMAGALHVFGHGLSFGIVPLKLEESLNSIINDRIEGEMLNADRYETDEGDEE